MTAQQLQQFPGRWLHFKQRLTGGQPPNGNGGQPPAVTGGQPPNGTGGQPPGVTVGLRGRG